MSWSLIILSYISLFLKFCIFTAACNCIEMIKKLHRPFFFSFPRKKLIIADRRDEGHLFKGSHTSHIVTPWKVLNICKLKFLYIVSV